MRVLTLSFNSITALSASRTFSLTLITEPPAWHGSHQVVFQPHRFSRTAHLKEHFGSCFNGVDQLILTDIYGAGEEKIDGVNESTVVDEVRQYGTPQVAYVPFAELIERIQNTLPKKAVVAFLGAGNITEVADECATLFKNSITRK